MWFERRQIDPETAARYGIFTASFTASTKEVLPDPNGNIIVFPTIERGVVVNEKYRLDYNGERRIWQMGGGRRTFWNSDALDDPALADGRLPLVITEGEPDALTAIDCGFPLSVSVPDGASDDPRVRGEVPEDLKPLDPGSENSGKFEFLWNNRERLKHVKRFILAGDTDAPGRRLVAELVRRLSAVRCSFVVYPQEPVIPVTDVKELLEWPEGKRPCKDLNEVRMHFGPEAVTAVLNGAKPYPVRGLYRLSDYPELPPLETFSTGYELLDKYIRLFAGEFMVVTGIPGHGKSTWVLNLIRNLADRYGWRTALFSPEMPTVPQLRDKVRRLKLGRDFDYMHDKDVLRAIDTWIDDTIVFIDSDPAGRSEEALTVDWILDRASDAVLRDGIRVLVIDPWNEAEHAKDKSESMGDYIGRMIRAIKRWGLLHGVVVIVVAHPTKEVGKDGKPRPPTPYDIDGSAHWYNKPDHIVVVWSQGNESAVLIRKVRFDGTGEKGQVKFKFDNVAGHYLDLNTDLHSLRLTR